MNARVFMVLVFSSVFMGIWNSDQKAMHSAIARNKRLSKPIAVFPVPPVETVRSENLSPLEFSVPEPRPVRVAMRASDNIGQSEPVIERHEEPGQQQQEADMPVVNLTPISDDVPEPQNTSVETESIPAEGIEAVVVEPTVTEEQIPELAMSEAEDVAVSDTVSSSISITPVEVVQTEGVLVSTESAVAHKRVEAERVEADAEMPVEESAPGDSEITATKADEAVVEMPAIEVSAADVDVPERSVAEPVTQTEQEGVPAPEDFSVEVKTGASASEAIEAETLVTAEAPVMVAENSSVETVQDHSGEVPVESETEVTEPAVVELPEPAEPVVVQSAAPSDAVAMTEEQSIIANSNSADAKEEEKSLEEKLLKSGEYDMLDVHAEDVTPGTVEPPLDGGATCIPLPRNLASGTWQVIHPSGEFFKITVDRGSSSTVNHGVDDEETLETSFCITAAPDGVRWCFIRSFVDSPAPVRRVTTEFFSPGQR